MEDLGMTMAEFWRGRRVLLTGHTGFKGAWTALWLEQLGAEVNGFALSPSADRHSMYTCLSPWPRLRSTIANLRDHRAVLLAVEESDPEIVIHMAAQSLVRRSYREPVETFGSNVMGTVHLLSTLASRRNLRAILVVTSDKVYDNADDGRAFCEDDPLAGDDPYSASKAATELVVRSWRKSFFSQLGAPRLGTARAGNVIGGGDWGEDRLVPDVIRAGLKGAPVLLRYPTATRPWQHVLDVVSGYLAYVQFLAEDPIDAPNALNFGPGPSPQVSAPAVCDVVDQLQAACGWPRRWFPQEGTPVAEKVRLALDSRLAAEKLGWRPKLTTSDAMTWTARWHKAHVNGLDMRAVSLKDVAEFTALPMPAESRIAAE